MAVLATMYDVEARLQRTPQGLEIAAAVVLLDEAAGIVRRNIPGIDAAVDADVNLAAIVAGKVSGAVARVLRNPEGMSSETIGGIAYRRADAVADGRLYLSDDELDQMRPVTATRRVGSQRLLARNYELPT